jgi:hypothetical protein
MARDLPPAIIKANAFKEYVQKDMNLKGGPVLMTFSYMLWNECKAKHTGATPDELYKGAINLYNEKKKEGVLEKLYRDAEKRFADKKAAKKAANIHQVDKNITGFKKINDENTKDKEIDKLKKEIERLKLEKEELRKFYIDS